MDRDDERLATRIREALNTAERFDTHEVNVSVSNGEVTLTGLVKTAEERNRVHERARETPGVRSVDNKLEIATSGAAVDETGLSRNLKATLSRELDLDDESVRVSIGGDRVVLEGSVTSDLQKQKAEQIAQRYSAGREIRNLLTVTPPASPEDNRLATAVQRAIDLSDAVSEHEITVSVAEGDVTLRGAVTTWIERKAAYDAAVIAAEGATVHDEIRVGEIEG